MQRIVDEILYDTNTATMLYLDESDKRRWYVTPNGRFFIAFANGEIIPVTEEKAKEFIGKVDVAQYIALWGEPQEG